MCSIVAIEPNLEVKKARWLLISISLFFLAAIYSFLVILQMSSGLGPSFVIRRKSSPQASQSSGVQGFVICFFLAF